jgi:hypothetical protein
MSNDTCFLKFGTSSWKCNLKQEAIITNCYENRWEEKQKITDEDSNLKCWRMRFECPDSLSTESESNLRKTICTFVQNHSAAFETMFVP